MTAQQLKKRIEILRYLDASRSFMDQATPREIAKELIVQGLDVVRRSERAALVKAAIAELDELG